MIMPYFLTFDFDEPIEEAKCYDREIQLVVLPNPPNKIPLFWKNKANKNGEENKAKEIGTIKPRKRQGREESKKLKKIRRIV